MNINKQY